MLFLETLHETASSTGQNTWHVRRNDQAWYPHVPWPHGWTSLQRSNATPCWLKQGTHTHTDNCAYMSIPAQRMSPLLSSVTSGTVNLAPSWLSQNIRLSSANRGAPKLASNCSTQPLWKGKPNTHSSVLEKAPSHDCWLLGYLTKTFAARPLAKFVKLWGRNGQQRQFATEPRWKEKTLMFEIVGVSCILCRNGHSMSMLSPIVQSYFKTCELNMNYAGARRRIKCASSCSM